MRINALTQIGADSLIKSVLASQHMQVPTCFFFIIFKTSDLEKMLPRKLSLHSEHIFVELCGAKV